MKKVSFFCLTTHNNNDKIITSNLKFISHLLKGEDMPIALAPIGQNLRVLKVTADEETKRHLEDIGITVNAQIQLVSKSGRNIIVLVKNCRLAIDGNLSMKILVA